ARPVDAIAAVEAGATYDVVLVDMHMPEMDGLQLAARLRELEATRSTPMLMLTSLGQRPEGSRDLGLVHLTKPVKAGLLRDAVARALGAADRETKPVMAQEAQASLRVLLAEDNLVNQRVGQLLVQRAGHRVTVVGNGREAVRAVVEDELEVDVILMDLQMPEMDGLEATRQIRAARGDGPYIIALTANATGADRYACREAGMNGFLSKPLQSAELGALLERQWPSTPVTAPAAYGKELR
ncbi:MAG: two-component hybrid sensor and regulator, partial [Friedmanniella sp.]|nr:two-component hybrid sensor and regulator [Friedmanniella sp.]